MKFLKLIPFLVVAFLFTASQNADALTLIDSLKTETPEIFTDSNSVEHKLYFSNSHPQFLKLIEQSISDISTTPLGKSLFQYVMGCDSGAISRHFGISSQKALELASTCFRNSYNRENRSPYILESQGEKIETKLSIVPGTGQRQYVLVISDKINWAIDSWTDPISNKTVFVIGKDVAGKPNYKAFFYQMMAHELAIYFDTKAWVNSSEWSRISEFDKLLNLASDRPNKLALALNNPVISQLFRSLRAFRAEKIFMEQLVADNKLSPDPLKEYERPTADYLRSDCGAPCVFSFVKIYSRLLLPQSLPLLAFSPQYRSQKMLEVLSHAGDFSDIQAITQVLERNSEVYLRQIFNNDPFFNMVSPKLNQQQETVFLETAKVFKDTLLPEDLNTISDLVIADGEAGRDFLLFLGEPLLGGKNVRLSGGPRPRIRPWERFIEIYRPRDNYFFDLLYFRGSTFAPL